MKINVDTFGGTSTTLKYTLEAEAAEYKILLGDFLEQEEVDSFVTDLMDDTIFNRASRDTIIQKLIDLDVIDKEMMEEYLEGVKEGPDIE